MYLWWSVVRLCLSSTSSTMNSSSMTSASRSSMTLLAYDWLIPETISFRDYLLAVSVSSFIRRTLGSNFMFIFFLVNDRSTIFNFFIIEITSSYLSASYTISCYFFMAGKKKLVMGLLSQYRQPTDGWRRSYYLISYYYPLCSSSNWRVFLI